MERNKGEGYDFKQDNGFQPMGGKLKPIHEISADLTNEVEVEAVMKYLGELGSDKELQAIQKGKRSSKLTIQQKMEMFKKDPGGTFIVKNGKKIGLAQFSKNNKAMNSRDNFNFQEGQDPNYADGNNNVATTPNSDYNSMVNNTKKVK